MKRKRFSDEQVIGVLKEHKAGAKVDDICRQHAISSATFYTWYGGVEARDAKRLRELEAENAKLKRIVADQCWTSSTTTAAFARARSSTSRSRRATSIT